MKAYNIEKDELKKKILEGLTNGELADYFGCKSTDPITDRKKKWGLTGITKNQSKKTHIIDKEQLKQKILEGFTNVELGKYFSCSDSTIKARKREYGLVGLSNNRSERAKGHQIEIPEKLLTKKIKEGYTEKQLANYFNCDATTISSRKREYNLIGLTENNHSPDIELITYSELIRVLNYSPNSGIFTWKINRGSTKKGDIAGYINDQGYIWITIYGKEYAAHRLAYLYMTKAWPTDNIDHINHIRNDNKWDNLRNVTPLENSKNQSLAKNNTSGICGISYEQDKWRATIHANGSKIHLGIFEDKEEAIKVRKEAEIKYGFHENHGKTREEITDE